MTKFAVGDKVKRLGGKKDMVITWIDDYISPIPALMLDMKVVLLGKEGHRISNMLKEVLQTWITISACIP